MRVLVTGHNGYIGSVMVPLLQAAGHEVTGLDTGFFEPCLLGGQAVTEIPSVRKDLRDVELADLEGFEAVVHLAGLSNDPLGNLDPLRPAGKAGRRPAVPVLLLLQHLWRRGGRLPR
jgi:nucleoside-diphosphate-sugar epimerase